MSLTGFFKENVVSAFNEKQIVVSDRFKDENGEVLKWTIKPMKASQILEASDNAVVTRGRTAEFKSSQYFLGIVINSVVYPDLNNAELQDSYGVMDSYSLINAMLNAEEFQRLQTECNKINGLDKTFEDLKDEVKN
ncbi:MAG: hypothetical protein SOR77_08660 [Peptoniphilus sp.]|uniref:phage tail assembly chaperone n=1 Tax=Peptoniphilus sp. TaxID=1971214 RepID=UPI002A763329|nr:hypothetical protein [Peptoniphilus sp.]MDY2987688.1 hypothetical protein [Peptoniphilus sp.]